MNESNNKTLDYYNQHFESYSKETLELEFTSIQDRFLSFLKPGALILDFGCGAGRDTKYFLSKGFRVEAIDGSEEMVKIASRNTGIQVKNMLFSDLSDVNRYDAIFACASILHVPYDQLTEIFSKMKTALKDNGIIYVSFKYGDFEGYRNGRYYTDLNEKRLNEILNNINDIVVLDTTISTSVILGREDEKWINVILAKK